jgi:hypothetical protein
VPSPAPSTDFIRNGTTFFGGADLTPDYDFAKTALRQLSSPNPIADFALDDASQTLTLTAPRDLQERLRVTLPLEVRDGNHRYSLCSNKSRVADAIERARQAKKGEETWPSLHYLWQQHPIMDWLSDRVLTSFGRHRAPVIRCPQLAEGEQAFMLMGLIPNRKGQPLLIDWQVAVSLGDSWCLEPFAKFVERTNLKANSLANRNHSLDTAALQSHLPEAVATMKSYMVGLQDHFAADMKFRLEGTLADLERLQKNQFEQLELRVAANQQAEQFKRTRRERSAKYIHKVFDEYKLWVRDTMTTEPQPFIQVLAAAVR